MVVGNLKLGLLYLLLVIVANTIYINHATILNKANSSSTLTTGQQRYSEDKFPSNLQHATKQIHTDGTINGSYIFPDQAQPHEATWLQWPHSHQFGDQYQKQLENIWVAMTKALSKGEIVRIIAYDQEHLDHVKQLLQGVSNVELFIWKTNDVWVRDNGPIFARDTNTGELVIQHWGFNGWGGKFQYENCAKIPSLMAENLNFTLVDVTPHMVLEGGSVGIDGQGTMLVCESSILNKNRNYGLSKQDAEYLFRQYYGVSNIIWLKGVLRQQITDGHVDEFAKFFNHSNLITLSKEDLKYWGLKNQDIQKLHSFTNVQGQSYEIIQIPLTVKQYPQEWGYNNLKGSYINLYVGNEVVLVPQYGDDNDEVALSTIQDLYKSSNRMAVGINVVKLFAKGGAIHCVTQQQPRR